MPENVAMICHRCKCTTSLKRQETTGNTQVNWYECPVCAHEQMTSRPIEERRGTAGSDFGPLEHKLRVGVGR